APLEARNDKYFLDSSLRTPQPANTGRAFPAASEPRRWLRRARKIEAQQPREARARAAARAARVDERNGRSEAVRNPGSAETNSVAGPYCASISSRTRPDDPLGISTSSMVASVGAISFGATLLLYLPGLIPVPMKIT